MGRDVIPAPQTGAWCGDGHTRKILVRIKRWGDLDSGGSGPDAPSGSGSLPVGPSRLAGARQEPPHHFLVRIAAAAMEHVLLRGLLSEGCSLFFGLSLLLRKRHPFANDLPARFVVFHVDGHLTAIFSTPQRASARHRRPRLMWATFDTRKPKR